MRCFAYQLLLLLLLLRFISIVHHIRAILYLKNTWCHDAAARRWNLIMLFIPLAMVSCLSYAIPLRNVSVHRPTTFIYSTHDFHVLEFRAHIRCSFASILLLGRFLSLSILFSVCISKSYILNRFNVLIDDWQLWNVHARFYIHMR